MSRQVYQEDYSCIIDPVDGKGGLYIGNLEAAQNIPNLRSIYALTQDYKSRPSSLQPKEQSQDTPNMISLTSFIFPLMITNLVISASTSIKLPTSSMIVSRGPVSWCTVQLVCLVLFHLSSHTSSNTKGYHTKKDMIL